ncbi:regulator of chromosome condensation 1/beta-lactamase-inhibitor protein II [Trichoderma aethiopicum]
MDAVYAIGSNGSGQLGITHKEDVSVPKPAVFHPDQQATPPRIIKVAAGGNHTLLLTEAGKLYWSGDPTSGACGLRPFPNIPVFLEARLAKENEETVGEIALVAATWEASVIVSRDEEDGKRTKVFSFGIGQKGELGLGELIVRTPSATRIKDFPPAGTEIVDLSACMGHVVAVLDNGEVYGWGNCRKAQIGEPAAVVFAPRKIEGIDFKAVRAVCAKEATCIFGESGSGNMRVLGSDKWGLVSQAPSAAPAWKDVGASWGNFYILGQDGRLTAWGRDDHGQLPPPNLPPLEKIAIGSEHVVALTVDGDVLSWGWGEHGNCGPKTSNNDVKGRWNVIASSKLIPPESKIDNIGAGCATSWICITSR